MSFNKVKRRSHWMENYEAYNAESNYYIVKNIKRIVEWG